MRRGVLVLLALLAPCGVAQAADDDVRIEVLSNRADVISGGDALIRVHRPSDADGLPLEVSVGGRGVKLDSAGVGLVEGLDVGRNVVTAQLADGRGARITITNHPIGGPVFAGPQVTPWICKESAKDAQCNRRTTVSYMSMNSYLGVFEAYDPKAPPPRSQIATTTTDEGKKVPYIVRIESGVMDRGDYAIAVLEDAWNGKLLTAFGPNTGPHHTEPAATTVMDDKALSRGFMVANNGLQIHGENTNDVVSTEAFMMLKEHIIERYGPIRYTMAEGCSGGSYQVMDEAMYPGLIDGLQPSCTFADLWTTLSDVLDCGLFVHYFSGAAPGGPPLARWMPAIDGHRDPSNCAAWDATFYNYIDPTNADHCKLPAEQVYDPDTNPGGERCTIADYMRSIFGPRPSSQWTEVEKKIGRGFANRPWGNEGVEYGLRALKTGQITPEEFVDLNQKIGGIDIDGKPQAERTAVDENTAAIAYRSGAVMDATWLEDKPIIDLRPYDETAGIHHTGNSVKLRARLDRDNGHHDNQITWTYDVGVPIVGVEPPVDIKLKSFLLMDKWLSNIEADKRDIPKARKVVLDKPGDAVDACFAGSPGPAVPGGPSTPGNQEITDPQQCGSLYPYSSLTRPSAGAPATDDVIQCALSPIDPANYQPATLTEDQLATLRATFPHGVCDYTKRAVGQQDSIPWTTYEDGPGGRPLGPAPMSVPFAPPGFTPGQGSPGATREALVCTRRRLVLADVVPGRRGVRLHGYADRRYVGRRVAIVGPRGRVVARARIRLDGTFRATAPLPARPLRASGRARYQARLGRERSAKLKLTRRMRVTRVRARNGRVTIAGRISGPLTVPPAPVEVRRRISCGRWERVATIRAGRRGRFRTTLAGPPRRTAATYRFTTLVPVGRRGSRIVRTYTLPVHVDLG
jgi:hypothetical protein